MHILSCTSSSVQFQVSKNGVHQSRHEFALLKGKYFLQAVCTPFELQALLSMDDWTNQAASLSDRLVSWPSPRSRTASLRPSTPNAQQRSLQGGAVLTVVLGPLTASLTSLQLDAALTTVLNMSTELKAGQQGYGRLCSNPEEYLDKDFPAASLSISLEVPEACLVAVSDQRDDLQLADSPYFAAPSGGSVQLLVGAPCVRLGLTGSWVLGSGPAGVHVSLLSPLAWCSPNLGVYIPVTDVQVGVKAQVDVGATNRLLSRTGAPLPCPRVAINGNTLSPTDRDCGTVIQSGQHVLLTLHELQMEVKVPAAADGALEGGQGTALPPLQVFLAIDKAVAHWRASPEECMALYALKAAAAHPLPGSRQQQEDSKDKPTKGLHLQFSLGTLQTSVCPEDSAGSGGALARGNVQIWASNLGLTFEQQVAKVI